MLLGFALRAGRLDFQSLWYDEGSSVFLARQSLGAITVGTAHDIHPPLYYYFLHFWMAAAGPSEYAVRSLSVAAGVLIVALLFALGRRLFGSPAGLIAALAGAVSPLLVYYSQETRMYAQVTLFGLLSTYLLVQAADSRRKGGDWLWGAYGVAAAACLYSQYIGVLALAFQGVFVLVWRRRRLVAAAVSAGAAVLAFVPWLAIAKDSLLGWPSTDAFHAGVGLFGDAAFRYVEGLSASEDGLGLGLTAAVCVLALGLIHPRPPHRERAGVREPGAGDAATLTRTLSRQHARGHWGSSALWLPALYLLVPLVAMFALGYRKPVYNPKFALLALPGFLLLLAVGVARLGKLRVPAVALVLAASGYALNNYYANPEFARDDYRGIAHFISSSGRPGDAIVLDAPGQEQVFPYYYGGPLPVIGLPADRPLNPDKTAQQLTQLNGQFKRLWLVLYGTNGSDPDSYVERWLASKDFEVQNQWFGNVRLAAFAAPSASSPETLPAAATLGGFARLTGYTLTPRQTPSGDVLQLGLKWKALGPGPGNLKVFTHVIDDQGNIWAQRDSEPAGGARPTSAWKPGESIDDNYGLLVLPGTPPGEYQAEIGMYDPARPTARAQVTAGGSGDRLLLGGIQVTAAEQPPSLDELRVPHVFERQMGAIKLLGYGLTLVGQENQRDAFAAGDAVGLTLFWEATAPPGSDAEFMLRLGPPTRRGLLGALDRGVPEQAPPSSSALPAGASPLLASGRLLAQHPTAAWRPGDRYRDEHRLVLPRDVKGDFDLVLWLNGRDSASVARIHVR